MSIETEQVTRGIAEVAELTGLSADTLRWYEREGLIPRMNRTSAGRRCYDAMDVRIIHLIVRLRRTGMPVAEIRDFLRLYEEGAASHGRRITLLETHRLRVLDAQARLAADLAAVDDKIEHYRDLIAAGLDCHDSPITDPEILTAQRSRT